MDQPTTTIDVVAKTCIAGRLRLLNRVITNIYDDAFRPFGLKISQGNVLILTGKLGLATPAQICEYLQLDMSTLSRNVEVMRKKGWLEIVPGADARSRPFRLTAQGKRLIERAMPAWEQAQEQTRELLGHEFVAQLSKAVARVNASHRA
jgi:DNA-binding MarR family transcriptional regulator